MSCILKQSVAAKRLYRVALAAFGLLVCIGGSQLIHAASPELTTSLPRGGKRGTELKVTFYGTRLNNAQELLFHEPGLSFKDLKPLDDKKVEATIVIAPDCRLGEHHVRIRATDGTTYARTFWVSQFDNVAEAEPNDDFDAPQKIANNVTVEGEAKPEDVDYYQIQAKKGDRISVEVEALRINTLRQQVAVDPYVAILDKDRFELAVSDDSALLKQESVVSIIAPEDGNYVVEVRDSAYEGRGRYRVHIGSFPRPLGIYPAGGQAGSEMEFTLIGDPKGQYKQKVKLPEQTTGAYEVFGQNAGLYPPSGNKVRVTSLENVLETEPNNSIGELKEAEGKPLPRAFNGILATEGDNDYFKFTAKKGQKFSLKVYANTIGTPVDALMVVYDAKGKSLGSNDDADGSPDSKVDFTAPEDGEYFVRVKDMLNRGGEDFVYRIESQTSEPEILVSMPEMQRRDTQYRKQFDVPRGNSFAMVVNTSRRNFSGDLVFDLPELPKGVTWEAGTIPKTQSSFPILLKAAADAPIEGSLYPLLVKNADPEKPVVGRYIQELDLVRGNPNGALYYTSDVDTLPIAVVEEVPFSISIEQPKIPLTRNGTMNLKVVAHRKEGFDGKITLRMLWRPPGIGCPSTVSIDEKKTEATYELNANGNAEVGTWKMTLLGEASQNGLITVAAPFVNLAVEEPFVDMKMTMASVPQTQEVAMLCDVSQLRPFEGKAKVSVQGLPAEATADPVEITKADEKVTFMVKTTEKTPVGMHKNLFCAVEVPQAGLTMLHKVGQGGTLRVDPKPKAPAEPKPAADKKEEAKKEAPKEKPLSRLEQLRLEAMKGSGESGN